MLFLQLIGNTAVKTLLQRMVDTHTLPSVLLFHGPAGVGKRRFAEEMALHLLASAGPAESHPDLHSYFPDKNGLHSIASIRELLRETSLPPFAAPVKVFIIHSAEKMLPTSSNALLKILEEPPAATWFILLSTDVSAILPTVFSRCRPIAFRPLSQSEITTYLTTRYGNNAPLDARLVQFSEGSLEKLEALRKAEDPKQKLLLDILRAGLLQWKTNGFEPLQRLEEILKENEKEETVLEERKGESLLSVFLYWIRDLCLLQAGGHPASVYYREHLEELQNQANQMKPLNFLRLYSVFERAHARLASNVRLISVIEECIFLVR
jgi:DNA polymerase III subunit delta'